jgi:hypothetical protein
MVTEAVPKNLPKIKLQVEICIGHFPYRGWTSVFDQLQVFLILILITFWNGKCKHLRNLKFQFGIENFKYSQ